jgi:hypothetical protein
VPLTTDPHLILRVADLPIIVVQDVDMLEIAAATSILISLMDEPVIRNAVWMVGACGCNESGK